MRNIILAILIITSTFAFSQEENTEKSLNENDKSIATGMALAWVKYNNNEYYAALRTYKDLYKKAPNNAQLNFRIGMCLVEIEQMDSAILHLKKALEIDTAVNSKAYYALGRAYQYNENLNEAIDNYYIYKTKLSPKENERHFVNVYLRQCLTAKNLMANPVNVKVNNLGKNINSIFVDASPSITADGQTLVYTSRRKENVGGKIDIANEDYYDDVYVAKYNSETKTWNKSENIGSPINTEFHDANLSISPDGNQIFIYKNQLNETKSGDIYVSTKKSDDTWGKPKSIDDENVNSTYFESSASITSDGNTLYFVSERERGGYGRGDIYKSTRIGRTWGPLVNLGPIINTVDDEIGVYIHPDGKTLFFSSNGHNTMGMHDIFMSTLNEKGIWSEPINLGYPINTTKDEIHFVLTTDKKNAYISSDRKGVFGKTDIFQIDMSYYFKTNENIDEKTAKSIMATPLCIIKGTVIDSKTSEPIKTNVMILDIETGKTTIANTDEKGEYFATIPADKRYELSAKSKGYKPLKIKIKLPKEEGETPTVVKHLLLDKE